MKRPYKSPSYIYYVQVNQHCHLTYCTNVHGGDNWKETFDHIERYVPRIRKNLTTRQFGIGLRLSNQASLELMEGSRLAEFKHWLQTNQLYVFTINGFPYGGFHHSPVKDQVHHPDWTTKERVEYTKRLFTILAELLPEGMDGGVSTSPLSYRPWHSPQGINQVKTVAAEQLAEITAFLVFLQQQTGKWLHLDLEPEPDGIFETSKEFITFYHDFLLNLGKEHLQRLAPCNASTAHNHILRHIQLCLDVCHFAVEYEDIKKLLQDLSEAGINIGRIQISSAMKVVPDSDNRQRTIHELAAFDEPVYLHQTVLKDHNNTLSRFTDLTAALIKFENSNYKELRTHFHVPIFTQQYGVLESTQDDILTLLKLWKTKPFTRHLEVETYTWDVLPQGLQVDIETSITRELQWVLNEIKS
ncbi:MAG: metabolite traffic protein EboE [Methylococcaceae bacterium]